MKHDVFNEVVSVRLVKCRNVLCAKAAEYVTDEDRLSNFKQAAGLQSVSPEQALFGMVAKHMVALGDFCQRVTAGREVPYEMWDEKIGDIINYMLLLDAIVQENKKI